MSKAGDCRHFNGIQKGRCRAGVVYKTVQVNRAFGLPCLASHRKDDTSCAALEPVTEKEAAAELAALNEAVDDIMRGLCGQCGAVCEVQESERATVYMCPEHGFVMRQCRRIGEPQDEDEVSR